MSYLMSPMKKARLTLDYLSSNGGAMPEEVVNRFLVVMIGKSDFLSSVTSVKMNSTTYRIPTWEFASRALHKRTRGQALADAKRTTPTTAGPTITAYDYAAEITLEKEDFESGVDGAGMMNLVMNRLAERVKLDASEIAENSSTASADDDLDNYDGFYTAISTNTASAGSTRLSAVNCTSLFKSIPDAAQDDDLVFRTNKRAVIDYQNSVEDRPTLIGDSVLAGKYKPNWHGYEVKGDQVLPRNLGGGTNETIVTLCREKQYHVGFHRQITNASDEDIRAGTVFVVFTVRMGSAFAVEKHAAKLTAVLAS